MARACFQTINHKKNKVSRGIMAYVEEVCLATGQRQMLYKHHTEWHAPFHFNTYIPKMYRIDICIQKSGFLYHISSGGDIMTDKGFLCYLK